MWPLVTWAIVYLPRPFLLGFVGDDWGLLALARDTAPWSWARWRDVSLYYLNRPVTAPLQFTLLGVLGDSAPAWAAVGTLIVLATAVAVRQFLLEVLALFESDRPVVADLATAFWLVSPWAVGATAHPLNFSATITVGLFALSGALLLRGWRQETIRWVAPALLFALSCLLYETFYGQFVAFFVIGAAAGVHRRLGWRALWVPTVALGVVQVAAVAWNRIAPRLSESVVSKSVYAGWYANLAKNIALTPIALFEGTAELWLPLALLAALLAALAARGWTSVAPEVRRRVTWVVAASAVGAAGAAGVLAVAGYELRGNGHDSRTTMGLSFWLATALVPLLLLAARGTRPASRLHRSRHWLAAAAIILLGWANLVRTAEWGRAWRLGRSTAEAAPAADLRRAADGAVVLHVGPWHVAGIVPIAQRWAMSPAVAYAQPELRRLSFYSARDFVTRWDGATLEQRPTSVRRLLRLKRRLGLADSTEVAAYLASLPPELRVPATELWIWDVRTGRATRASAPFEHRSPFPGP